LVVLELTKQLPSKCFFVGFSLQSCSHTHTHIYIHSGSCSCNKAAVQQVWSVQVFCELWFCSTVGSQGAFH
jgi:hypothetical protein